MTNTMRFFAILLVFATLGFASQGCGNSKGTCSDGKSDCGKTKASVGAACGTNADCASKSCYNEQCECLSSADCTAPKDICATDTFGAIEEGSCFAALPNGTPCLDDLSCASDICGQGGCEPPQPPGGECSRDKECAQKKCDGDKCATLPDGAACESETECTSFSCVNGVCGKAQAGDQCKKDDDCKGLLWCALDGKCTTPVPDGGMCPRAYACASFNCFNGTCESSKDGSPCNADVSCDSSQCVEHVCITPGSQADGTACTISVACVSGLCDLGTCQTPKSAHTGAACENNEVCQSQVCTMGVCGPGANGTSCVADFGCTSGFCNALVCIPAVSVPLAGACTEDADCQSQDCASGVCSCVADGDGVDSTLGSNCDDSYCFVTRCCSHVAAGDCGTNPTSCMLTCEASLPLDTPCTGAADCYPYACTSGECACLQNGFSCQHDGKLCCSGACGATSGLCCTNVGVACAVTSDCCPGLTCDNGLCANDTGVGCTSLASSCSPTSTCCSNLVCGAADRCVKSNCGASGATCTTGPDCCGFVCNAGVCN